MFNKISKKSFLIKLISVLIFLLVWEIYGRQINPIFISYPTAIFKTLFKMLFSYELIKNLRVSLLELFYGFSLSLMIGIPLGLLMGRIKLLEDILEPFVNAIYSIPRIVFIPLLILWFGIGISSKVALIILLATFPILINTYSGVKNIDKNLIDLAKSFNANEKQILSKIIFPASLPFIFTGIRLGIGMAMIGMILGGMFVGLSGLGSLLIIYANRFQTEKVFAVIILLSIIGISLTGFTKYLEKKIIFWK